MKMNLKNGLNNNHGFTLVEILMILLLVAILSAVAIPQFVDFQDSARNSSVQGSLGALRTGILNQRANLQLRCGDNTGNWPTAAQIAGNDIIIGGPCIAGNFANASDRLFVSGAFPSNPWGSPPAATVTNCAAAGCTRSPANGTSCDNTGTFTNGWCYNSATGEIWADSQNNGTSPFEEAF